MLYRARNSVDVNEQDLERLKQDILSEVRKELLRTKNEIIEGKSVSFNLFL